VDVVNDSKFIVMKNVLVLCTGNSCRSQLAEGYLKHFAQNKAKIYSAGIEVHGVNPRAIKVMAEDGIDISGQTSNNMITVCDHAKESCPYFPTQAIKMHHNFPDPAKAVGTDEEIMAEFRNTRDLVKVYMEDFVNKNLKG
jgi:arsenate reductase (thioredoxin)